MKKKNVIKRNEDFNRMINTCRYYKNDLFILYVEKDKTNKTYHFGISVGKKIGNAVVRNKIKRQIKSIVDQKDYSNEINCIIMVKKSVLQKTYSEMEDKLIQLMEQAKIFKGELHG